MKSRGIVVGGPRILLRIEGAAVLSAGVFFYARSGSSWWMFAALLLTPDVSMLGYLLGRRLGAAFYNAAHTVTAPIVIVIAASIIGDTLAASLGAIWIAHIGLDRMLGYGLKYVTGFGDTHLGALGRDRLDEMRNDETSRL